MLNTDSDAELDDDQVQDVSCDGNTNESKNDEDKWGEDEGETPAGVTDTMLTATDSLEDSERQQILNVAPGEVSRHLSIFRDKYSEQLAYPSIFLGQKRPDYEKRFVPVHFSDICESELRRSDRRSAMCV